MGATNEIKGTNITQQLTDKQCPQCSQLFTEQDLEDRNFEIWWDTSNEVELKELPQISYSDRGGYRFSIWIRSIEHEYCPTVKECQKCYTKFLEEKMIETQDSDFYCQSCYQGIKAKKF